MLKDMAMTPEEAKEYTSPSPSDAPKYPWGLQLSLCDDDITKLGIGNMAAGTKVTIMAEATVTNEGTSQNQSGEAENNMSMQITAMDITGVNGKTSEDQANDLYGS